MSKKTKIEFHTLYDHPLWKRKRAAILKRDNYKCTVCGSIKDLQVHHTYYYIEEMAPWLYPDESLLTLCEDCHHSWHIHNELTYVKNPRVSKKKHKSFRSYSLRKLKKKSLAQKVLEQKRAAMKKKSVITVRGKQYKI